MLCEVRIKVMSQTHIFSFLGLSILYKMSFHHYLGPPTIHHRLDQTMDMLNPEILSPGGQGLLFQNLETFDSPFNLCPL